MSTFRVHVGDQVGIGLELLELIGEPVQRENTAAHRIACGVVATDDQQHEVAQEFHRSADQILGVGVALQHGDQIEPRFFSGSGPGRFVVPVLAETLCHLAHTDKRIVEV